MVEDEVKAEGIEGEEEEGADGENQDKFAGMDEALQQKVKDTFIIFDKEQTGMIDVTSLGTLLRWLRFNPTDTEMTEYVQLYDVNQRDQISLDNVMTIVYQKSQEPDTIEEFVEAAKIFDHDNDGKIEVSELRFALCRLGQPLEENLVDDLIAELDREKTGLVDIMDWAKITFK